MSLVSDDRTTAMFAHRIESIQRDGHNLIRQFASSHHYIETARLLALPIILLATMQAE